MIIAGKTSNEDICQCRSCWSKSAKQQSTPVFRPFIVCPTCGNKRCPRANHHENACTNSNDPGQAGSYYE